MNLDKILIGLLGVIVLTESTEDERFNKQPFGPKMCKSICLQISGCSSFAFSPSELYCHVTKSTKTKTGIVYFNITQMLHKACSRHSKYIRTRLKDHKCIKPSRTQKVDSFSEKRTSLLLVPSHIHTKGYHMYQLDLSNLSQSPYPYINTDSIAAVVFVQRKLLVSRYQPIHQVESYALYSNVSTVLIKNFSPDTMSVDEAEALVFGGCKNRSVIKMTVNGENVRCIKTMEKKPRTVAVDPKRKLLYVCQYGYITSLTYNGLERDTIVHGKDLRAFTVDDSGNYIYFCRSYKLCKMSLDGKKESKVAASKLWPRMIVFYNETIFMTFLYKRTLSVVHTARNQSVRMIELADDITLSVDILAIP